MTDLKNLDEHKKNNMAIVVVSYDGYSDLWDDFFQLLNENWGNRTYPTYLVNNTKQPNYTGVKVLNCGENAQWSTRTREAIKSIQEPYICLLLEDYFIGAEVDNNQIKEAINLMEKDKLKYYKLSTFSKIKTEKYKESLHLHNIPGDLEYGVSLQAAIWDKEYLLKLIGDEDYNAWKFEIDRIRETERAKEEVLVGCVFDNRNILNICHGVAQGKYLPPAVKYFEKRGRLLNTNSRPVMTKKEYMYYCTKGIVSQIIPNKLKNGIKVFLKFFGFKFVSLDNKNM
ncbi:hypothetical protein [Bacillus cereus group sp. MYBK134-1]|uniref:hypothetical protein n=1 Tax=unclassified Bacillus cereus group TaxID=2750818 RepID=UPI003F794F0F